MFEIRKDDLTGEASRALVALHLAGMHASSPPGHVFALDLSGLLAPGVTVWTVWRREAVMGMGALKQLGERHGELKSMRTHPDHLRQGVGAAVLDHMIGEASGLGLTRLSLETGNGAGFEPALALYRSRCFVAGGAFSDYQRSAFNQFFHRQL